jgi:hypothetical protein
MPKFKVEPFENITGAEDEADQAAGEMIILTRHRMLEGQSHKLTALNGSFAFQRRILERFSRKHARPGLAVTERLKFALLRSFCLDRHAAVTAAEHCGFPDRGRVRHGGAKRGGRGRGHRRGPAGGYSAG